MEFGLAVYEGMSWTKRLLYNQEGEEKKTENESGEQGQRKQEVDWGSMGWGKRKVWQGKYTEIWINLLRVAQAEWKEERSKYKSLAKCSQNNWELFLSLRILGIIIKNN